MSTSAHEGLTEAQRQGCAQRAAREQRKLSRANRTEALSKAAEERRSYEDETLAEAESILTKKATRRALNRSRTELQESLDVIESCKALQRSVTDRLSAEIVYLRKELLKSRRQVNALTTQRAGLVKRLRRTTNVLKANGIKVDGDGRVVKISVESVQTDARGRLKPAGNVCCKPAESTTIRPAEAST